MATLLLPLASGLVRPAVPCLGPVWLLLGSPGLTSSSSWGVISAAHAAAPPADDGCGDDGGDGTGAITAGLAAVRPAAVALLVWSSPTACTGSGIGSCCMPDCAAERERDFAGLVVLALFVYAGASCWGLLVFRVVAAMAPLMHGVLRVARSTRLVGLLRSLECGSSGCSCWSSAIPETLLQRLPVVLLVPLAGL